MQKTNNLKGFAARYGGIDLADGVDEKEAEAIAKLFFYSTGFSCGVVSQPKKVGDRWKSEVTYGYAATPINPIWVDVQSGSVWQDGGDRIDDVGVLLRTAATREAEAGTGQPATRPESKSEGGDKPQPDAEGRSR
jgi:hypothetical protein